jgi:Golgi nucleoside diphosphatase
VFLRPTKRGLQINPKTTMDTQKHYLEDTDSWENHVKRSENIGGEDANEERPASRRLHHHHHHDDADPEINAKELEVEKEAEYWEKYEHDQLKAAKHRRHKKKKRKKAMKELWKNTGVGQSTVHGLMIDAGSTGSRMHVYEWAPRILHNEEDIQQAVSGEKLSFPGTENRWTERLHPGLASFGTLPDGELEKAVADYLKPLLNFAKTVLHVKEDYFGEFPIFLRATAGMRILNPTDRGRVIHAVRELFSNKTYCPFAFVEEQARVLSGEEEAIFDWAGVNFLMGDLVEESQGAGTVVNPRKTIGALDLGGGSTQIGFYEPSEDIMAGLFKLQIGQAKHWNVYTHSFLRYGMNEAIDRFGARLVSGKSSEERLVEGIHNPCLPGGAKTEIRTNIHLNENGVEVWEHEDSYASGNGFFQAVLKNENERGDPDACLALAKDLLHLEENAWCNFAHAGDCSFAGVYQPELPTQYENFGEFLAFSNYYHVWEFLQLPERATLNQLENATRYACSMSHDELVDFNGGEDSADLDGFCFQSAYAFQLLHNGFGFAMTDSIRAVKVINGHKVGWALGAMLYEMNTLPWSYSNDLEAQAESLQMQWDTLFVVATVFAMCATLFSMFLFRRRRIRNYGGSQYEEIKDVQMETKV